MKKKGIGIKIVLVILAVLGILLVCCRLMFRREMSIISSIKLIDAEKNLYEMTFSEEYHFDDVYEKGASSDAELADLLSGYISHGFYKPDADYDTEIGCSTICAMTSDGKMVWGRNFDWYDSVPIIRSVSVEFMGEPCKL